MDMAQSTRTVSGDFDLTMDELRVVARYVVRHAEDVLSAFELAVPDDPRPRAAIDAAWAFIYGANRTKLQRVTSLEAHRAARSAPPRLRDWLRDPPATPHRPHTCTPLPGPARSATSCEPRQALRASGRSRRAVTPRSGMPCWNGHGSVRHRCSSTFSAATPSRQAAAIVSPS